MRSHPSGEGLTNRATSACCSEICKLSLGEFVLQTVRRVRVHICLIKWQPKRREKSPWDVCKRANPLCWTSSTVSARAHSSLVSINVIWIQRELIQTQLDDTNDESCRHNSRLQTNVSTNVNCKISTCFISIANCPNCTTFRDKKRDLLQLIRQFRERSSTCSKLRQSRPEVVTRCVFRFHILIQIQVRDLAR